MRRAAPPFGLPLLRVSLAAMALMIAGAGCKPLDLDTAKIAAADTTEFVRWRRDTASKLSPQQQKQLETTVEELRLDIMLRQQASGRAAIESAVCQRLNQLTVREALALGAQTKWLRLAAERDDLQRVIAANARLIVKPGDRSAAADLDQYRAKHQQRLDALTQELPVLAQEIASLGGQVPTLQLSATATRPAVVSRAEALQQIADMLQGRRGAGALRYGAWPVRIDWTGQRLEGERRAEFLAKSSVNGRGERVVVPVRIKGRWLLFESADEAPVLPADVRAQLTAAELAAFKQDWIELEAELWARAVAKELPDPPKDAVDEDAPDTQPVLLRK